MINIEQPGVKFEFTGQKFVRIHSFCEHQEGHPSCSFPVRFY